MTRLPKTDPDDSLPAYLWDALSLGEDKRRSSSRDVDRILQDLGKADELDASGHVVRIRVEREQIESLLLPLALSVLQLAESKSRRVLVGITGGAGTGKTILSMLLCRVLNLLSGREIAAALTADAYHFPNAFLDTHVGMELGEEVPLRQIKGRPPTFDVAAMVADLRRLRASADQEIQLPVYDRRRHDPVPQSISVNPQHRIVIVEGLHLLRVEHGWQEARDCFDFCMLLELPLETCRRRVAVRKIAGGRHPADVDAHFDRVDRPTLEELQDPALRSRADLVIQLEEVEALGAEPRTCLRGCEQRASSLEALDLREIPRGSIELLAVGLNPALQKTLVFDRLVRGQVNRAREILTSVGGKGQQFSRAANHLIPGMVTLSQFLGGENGERLGRMIEHAGVKQITVVSSGETRCCITAIDASTGDATELIEPSAAILPGEAGKLLASTLQFLAEGKASGLALCGTWPPGVDETFYVALAQAKGNAILMLDSYRDISAVLATGQVDILKLNASELRSLAAAIRGKQAGEDDRELTSIPEMARSVFETYKLRWLAVTAGPDTAWLFESPIAGSEPSRACVWRFYEFRLPAIEGVVNPIGAGDTVGAVFLAQLTAGSPAPTAFACGLAAGSASCRQLGGADFAIEDLLEILAQIRVGRVTRRWTMDGASPVHE